MSNTGWVPDAAPPPSTSGWVPDATAEKPSWMDEATDFAKGLLSKMNPVAGIKGAAQLVAHPIDTYEADAGQRQDLLNKAEDAFKKGDYGTGMAHALYGIIPFLGPQMDAAGTKIGTGQAPEGLGESVGMGLNLSTPALVRGAGTLAGKIPGASNVADALSQRMYQTALKPPPGSNSLSQVKNMVNTGLQNAIPISEEGASKLNDLVSDLNDKVQAQIKAGSNAGATISRNAVAARLYNTAQQFSNQVNPAADLDAVRKSGTEFLNSQPADIPAADAQALKSGTYKQLSSKAYGEMDSATIESQKALARGIKEELENQFPEIKGLNAEEGKLLGLQPALERAVRRINNRDLLSLGGKIVSAGAGSVAGAMSGSPEGAAVGGAGALALHYAMTDPFVQSKLAIALNRASKGSIPMPTATARVSAYVNAFGNAANSSNPDASNSQ